MLTYFSGFRLIAGDGKEPVDNASMLVRDGLIVAVNPDDVPHDARRIDLPGKTMMPTLISPHGHLGYMRGAETSKDNYSRENLLDHLRRMTYHGVTVVQNLGTDRDDVEITLRDQQRSGELSDPDLALLLTASDGLVAPTPGEENGGAGFAVDVLHEISSAEQARQVVRTLAMKKPDVIKLWIDDRWGLKDKLGQDISAAAVDEAHSLGFGVVAHIYSLDDAKGALRAGVDGFAHLIREPAPDAEVIEALTSRDVYVFSSMTVQKWFFEDPSWLDDPLLAETIEPADLETFRQQAREIPLDQKQVWAERYRKLEDSLRILVDAGVRIVMSGDTGGYQNIPGFAEHRELEAMVLAGMPTLAALRAATLLPAEILGFDDRGVLAPGKRADLLILDADPLDAIANTRKIHSVVVGGNVIDRAALRDKIRQTRRTP
jgi:imidazolonepropionase-like amidohydrolase